MKLISKKFIKELSKLTECNICYQFISDPTECSECQNIWCTQCINQNDRKCPNKCQKCEFIRPHRIFRQVINEVYIQCDVCNIKVKQINYEKHKSSKQCKIGYHAKPSISETEAFNQPRKIKIIKRDQSQQLNSELVQSQCHEDLDANDSQTTGFSQNSQKENDQILDQNLNNCCLSQIFTDDEEVRESFNNNQYIVKEENRVLNSEKKKFISQTNKKYQKFKAMHLSLYKNGVWKPIDEKINTEINFQVLKQMEGAKKKSLQEINIKINNLFYDFSKFEVYEQYELIKIFDDGSEDYWSDSSTQHNYSIKVERKKLIGKFAIYNNEIDLKKRVKVYFLHENDIIYYSEQDQENILEQFYKNPNSRCVQTHRSQVDLAKMAEYTEKKVRDIKFELAF